MKEPTGLEHVTPVKITDTSATERAGFRKCRRQWFLTVVHRLDPQEGNPNFFVGDLVHGGLEEYYRLVQGGAYSHDVAMQGALDKYEVLYKRYMKKLKKQLTFVWSVAKPMWEELGSMGFEMLQSYLEAEEHNPILDEVLAVEFRVRVAIRDPETGKRVGWLSVQADLVGYKDGVLKVIDHKTRSRSINSAHLDIDDQLTAEVVAWWRSKQAHEMTQGEFPDKAVYNVLYKKVAKPPKRIKDRKDGTPQLSKAKSQGTTYELYKEEIRKLGLDVKDYVDILAYLKNLDTMGENVFFEREETFRSEDQIAAFERDLYWEFRDMKTVAAHPERAYPNPSAFNCPGCPVRSVCFAIQDGQDVESIIRAGFVIADPRR